MSGSPQWNGRLKNSLKNFDLSSPEVKQQFDQIGLTPEEVISKIMANPEIAMAFQNPRVQAAIMDIFADGRLAFNGLSKTVKKVGRSSKESLVLEPLCDEVHHLPIDNKIGYKDLPSGLNGFSIFGEVKR
ncbi:uncharacterized protein LOC103502106 isoform X1 [Cucumis melo]|uniref:Uncharacterized protein LOC103502106 isoform X1 n=1 Tax=Cucumis melo TaxID=3656 RepID=A0A1S3CKU8_CUCME|nr:uncharacterized protein LOC103502106 isoform X1 [Cucumis melo]XP_050935123.1 uncharacterized protein LOC103502106 isoform X1 [Cucumis melo]